MQIKKFVIDYGGFGFSDAIAMQANALVFSSWHVHNYPPKEVHITPTEKEWKSFVTAVNPVVQDWRRKYDLSVCDGVCWTAKIETDGFKLNSGGLHLFPENFAEFLVHVRRLIRVEAFASDFRADAFMSCTVVPHWINRRILRLMRSKKIKINEMAARLGFDPKELRHLLNSPVTFEIEYLGFISHILGVPIGDLLYESTLDEKPKGSEDLITPPDDLLSHSQRSTSDQVKDLLRIIHDN